CARDEGDRVRSLRGRRALRRPRRRARLARDAGRAVRLRLRSHAAERRDAPPDRRDVLQAHEAHGAIVINTSRGPVVDEQALARALQERRLAGAALDVWEQEPVAADNPLMKMDNVIATPHAAYFSTAAAAAVPRRCGEEVARVLTGQRPLNVVNPEVYAPRAVRRAR